MLVFLDTSILIWGIRGQANNEQKEKPKDTKMFLEELISNNHTLAIAAPSLYEFLICTPAEERIPCIHEMNKWIQTYPFDTSAALEGAKIWNKLLRDKQFAEIKKEKQLSEPYKRQVCKVDIQILSTAIVRGASCLITEDEDLQKIATEFIDVKPVPPKQITLFDQIEETN